jgi:hypothetical protein
MLLLDRPTSNHSTSPSSRDDKHIALGGKCNWSSAFQDELDYPPSGPVTAKKARGCDDDISEILDDLSSRVLLFHPPAPIGLSPL